MSSAVPTSTPVLTTLSYTLPTCPESNNNKHDHFSSTRRKLFTWKLNQKGKQLLVLPVVWRWKPTETSPRRTQPCWPRRTLPKSAKRSASTPSTLNWEPPVVTNQRHQDQAPNRPWEPWPDQEWKLAASVRRFLVYMPLILRIQHFIFKKQRMWLQCHRTQPDERVVDVVEDCKTNFAQLSFISLNEIIYFTFWNVKTIFETK